MAEAFILSEADMVVLEAGNPYGNGICIKRAPRQGGTHDNPDPCFVLSTAILAVPAFASVHAFLATRPVKDVEDPTYPPPLPDDEE